jgi:hypothetical protein
MAVIHPRPPMGYALDITLAYMIYLMDSTRPNQLEPESHLDRAISFQILSLWRNLDKYRER